MNPRARFKQRNAALHYFFWKFWVTKKVFVYSFLKHRAGIWFMKAATFVYSFAKNKLTLVHDVAGVARPIWPKKNVVMLGSVGIVTSRVYIYKSENLYLVICKKYRIVYGRNVRLVLVSSFIWASMVHVGHRLCFCSRLCKISSCEKGGSFTVKFYRVILLFFIPRDCWPNSFSWHRLSNRSMHLPHKKFNVTFCNLLILYSGIFLFYYNPKF